MRKNGIFFKIFSYTVVAMLFLVLVTAGLFFNQFSTLYKSVERRSIYESYQPLVNEITRSKVEAVSQTAQEFYQKNRSFEFMITDKNGDTLFSTPKAEELSLSTQKDFFFVVDKDERSGNSIIALTRPTLTKFYQEMIIRGLLIFLFIVSLCLVIGYIFTKQIADPIKSLAKDTKKMSNLQEVQPRFSDRKDELGDLSRDVHSMYSELKETIAHQQDEILREQEIEATQRYFFSAASHELKTPIAATSILLEGMLANIGDYKDHPKYLRECLNLMDKQSELVSEILEIVKLNEGKVLFTSERIDLFEIVKATLSAYQSQIHTAKQKIEIAIPSDSMVTTDQNILKKVLSNIIANALQNSPEEALIRIWTEGKVDSYRLNILNTESYIAPETLTKIFDPFYKVDKARTDKNTRSGLGLTIVQKMLDELKLSFSLENTSEGVQFSIDLPKA
ncbi:sensor histidine kinase [Enterococcus xiangfangensis]|uniref:sensor histidine kinase n=1 Tax=Enterococcus xiangfangensis TaxID=1296537 RepID=UPI0019573A74|nr:HAMP domain-containing sensor histidine kinase [Enterococcus xiangfangensis]MBM7711720.1 two-component system sensor histidine kinase VanS [Enterococcus xiangfangensis]